MQDEDRARAFSPSPLQLQRVVKEPRYRYNNNQVPVSPCVPIHNCIPSFLGSDMMTDATVLLQNALLDLLAHCFLLLFDLEPGPVSVFRTNS